MKKILVIGKNGYVSTSFQKYMQKFEDYQVDAITARNDAWREYDFSTYDAVFNTTGLAHNDARMGTREQFMALNAVLPVELAQKAKAEGVKVFINMSSMIIYGEMSELGKLELIDDKTVPVPAGIYGESKLAGEKGLMGLADVYFNVAIIRSPLVYGEKAVDNFAKLVNFAKRYPLFPDLENCRSMIYSDNLCELVRLIVDNSQGGLYYPQQEVYIGTSKLVKDIAKVAGNGLIETSLFNPFIRILSHKMIVFRKVFGNLAYDHNVSNAFDGKYRVVSYEESIKRTLGGMS